MTTEGLVVSWSEWFDMVGARISPEPNTGCWLWAGANTGATGYGVMRRRGRNWLVHRIAYAMFIGPIPKGLMLDHLCRTPCCVNPDHLEAVTMRENVLRGRAPSASHALKTHCPHGHEYGPENTKVWVKKTGAMVRFCRACHRADGRRRYLAAKGTA